MGLHKYNNQQVAIFRFCQKSNKHYSFVNILNQLRHIFSMHLNGVFFLKASLVKNGSKKGELEILNTTAPVSMSLTLMLAPSSSEFRVHLF